jgi:hypothetical protein
MTTIRNETEWYLTKSLYISYCRERDNTGVNISTLPSNFDCKGSFSGGLAASVIHIHAANAAKKTDRRTAEGSIKLRQPQVFLPDS